MTPDDVRALFSDALEGELEPAQQQAFDAALADDAELRAEYQAFAETLAITRKAAPSEPPRDLLPGVQRRLRARSRGRFYGDRFAQRAGLGVMHPVLLALLMLLLLGLGWVALEAMGTIRLP